MSDTSSMSSCNVSEFEEIDYKGFFLNNKYIILKLLGQGALSTVWFSYNINNKKFYAIKIQHFDYYYAAVDEINILRKVDSFNCKYTVNLVESFEYNIDKNCHMCMVFDVFFGTINDITTYGKYKHGFPLPIAKRIIYQTLTALNVLHNQTHVVHTDIKPENILVCGINNSLKQFIDVFNNFNFEQKLKNNRKKQSGSIKKTVNDFFSYYNKIHPNNNSDTDSNSSSNYSDSNSSSYSDSYDTDDTDDTDDFSSENDDTFLPLDEKYINNIHIKLSDFGSCVKFKHITNKEVQTRHFRAPEVILGHKYNEKIDIWSIGCLFYELLTGELLFAPIKDSNISRDRHHIYDIYSLFGEIPNNIINECTRKAIFFKKNGQLKGFSEIKYIPFKTYLMKKLKNTYDVTDIDQLMNFLENTFVYNHNARFSVSDCLKHPLFDDVRE